MCIFNVSVKEVGGTKIFVGRTATGRQLTVYRNYVSVDFDRTVSGRRDAKKLALAEKRLRKDETPTPAMILPFPHTPGEAVELIDLSKLPEGWFGDLQECFPRKKKLTKTRARRSAGKEPTKSVLAVKQVGSYNVSVAESLEDLRRIDPSVFTLADNVADMLAGHYAKGFGFIIACFRDNMKRHPLAYVHGIRGDKLFVPTMHHHHGEEEKMSDWDHEIFSVGCTSEAGESPDDRTRHLEATIKPQKERVEQGRLKAEDVLKALPVQLVEGDLRWMTKKGKLENVDTVFSAA